MSIDFEAYFRSKPKLPETLTEGPGWIINSTTPMRVIKDDFAQELLPYLKGRKWRTDINVEGNLTTEALEAWKNLRHQLIENHGALVYDPQADQLSDGDGTQPVISIDSQESEERGFSLQIFFENADKVGVDKIGQLLDILEAELPEALPHRYGHFEPAQWRWDDGGREAFLERWTNDDPPFWIGKTPVSYMFSNFAFKLGYQRTEFRSGSIEFQLKAKLARDPKKLRAVMIAAEKIAIVFNAFYAGLTEDTFDCSPWWKGLSPNNHLQLIMGPPLLELWQGIESISQPLGKRHRSIGGSNVGVANVSPPKALCYSGAPNSDGYAKVFPFKKTDPYWV
ncbi:hypothetical protein [Parasphingorhabdus halotolerans]|uniref:Uncharacterized protein n=1 Tax=Parasphingorhabdus halotolerans TaxID=2725558 RepID=A0A6H2DN44_9SPHN|nr:hypothetical protein [Parasphingorhabdus halotolerans]QJB69774.1 hypothetical protein HF685_11195 [Parasphingorhabdus halotolerans]